MFNGFDQRVNVLIVRETLLKEFPLSKTSSTYDKVHRDVSKCGFKYI